jgi:TolB-like protein
LSSGRCDSGQAAAGAADDGQPAPAAVRQELEQILDSEEFVASDRLRNFLRFVVEEALAGRARQLKAYTIGVEVFGRDARFDAQNDPVVRVEAGKLRRRLELYYLGPGANDSVQIDIPKGGYAPSFRFQGRSEEKRNLPSNLSLPRSLRPLRNRVFALGGLAIAGLVVLAFVVLKLQLPTLEALAGRTAPQERGPAIIVLPFDNLSASGADETLARGLTEELISNLMRFGELRLYSVYGSFQEEPTADPVELGKRLDVGYVIRGSVRRAPSHVRLIVHLVEVASGRHLWTETYDRALTPEGVFGLQEQLAADLASHLAEPYGIIHEVTADLFRRQRPETLSAYECVLRAFAYRRQLDGELYADSRACLERAVQLDAHYADAWAMLAFAYLDEYRFGYGPRAGDAAALDLALTTARHAVDLDPDGVHGLLALSSVQFYRREFAEAEAVHHHLLSLNPTNPEVLAQVGWRTAFAGDWDEGIGYLRQAMVRSIKAPDWYHLVMAFDHYRRGDYQTALAQMSNTAGTKWVFVPLTLAAIHGQLGNRDEAAGALDRAEALSPVVLRNPRAALEMHNLPEDLIDQLIEGLTKAGLEVSLAVVGTRAWCSSRCDLCGPASAAIGNGVRPSLARFVRHGGGGRGHVANLGRAHTVLQGLAPAQPEPSGLS